MNAPTPDQHAQRAPAQHDHHDRRAPALQIPKLRTGSLFPSLLHRRRRADQSLFAVIMEAYLHGIEQEAHGVGAGEAGEVEHKAAASHYPQKRSTRAHQPHFERL